MKILTLFGTRPEIIRLSEVIRRLDRLCEHVMVHTGQNYDPDLSDVFFAELGLRPPDFHLGIQAAGSAEQVGAILARAGEVLLEVKPERVLLLGDTNSALSSIVAARMGIPVYHMEAGNRCYDDRVPEEVNRRIIDHTSTVLMPYTDRSKENLLREGIPRERIYVIGNPIAEVLDAQAGAIVASTALERLEVRPGEYFLVTLHRAENVDEPARLEKLVHGVRAVAETYAQPVIVSLHPRTADKLRRFGLELASKGVVVLKPLGFCDFVRLEREARCVLTDSGTVQEECCIFRVPNVTLRDVTERAETVEAGSNILSGADPQAILDAVRIVLDTGRSWTPPPEYMVKQVSSTVAKVVLGYLWHGRPLSSLGQ
jgi:UDP-N-acetylglucosamine 2-epimerase (non-hydrolysing)